MRGWPPARHTDGVPTEAEIEVVRAFLEHGSRGRWGENAGDFADDVELVFSAEAFPDPGRHRGLPAVTRAWLDFLRLFDRYVIANVELIVADQRIVGFYDAHVRLANSDAEIVKAIAGIFTMRNGQIAEIRLCTRQEGHAAMNAALSQM